MVGTRLILLPFRLAARAMLASSHRPGMCAPRDWWPRSPSRWRCQAVTAMEYVHPTPIQAATVPVALLGRDICGCAATGTGKTAAFMLPILERLVFRPKQVNQAGLTGSVICTVFPGNSR